MSGLNKAKLEELYQLYRPEVQERIEKVVKIITETKQNQKRICVVTGSGPNIHEGVTTFIAELIQKGLIDSVLTSSAVISHEMAGSLDRVKRINASLINHPEMRAGLWFPKGDIFELTLLKPQEIQTLAKEMKIDTGFIAHLASLEGQTIIKAAGNMAYPMGLRTEMLAEEILRYMSRKLVFITHSMNY